MRWSCPFHAQFCFISDRPRFLRALPNCLFHAAATLYIYKLVPPTMIFIQACRRKAAHALKVRFYRTMTLLLNFDTFYWTIRWARAFLFVSLLKVISSQNVFRFFKFLKIFVKNRLSKLSWNPPFTISQSHFSRMKINDKSILFILFIETPLIFIFY